MLDWPARGQAERQRQWPLIVHAAESVAEIPGLDGLLLLGSFAAGRADAVSDVDLVAVVADGCFDDAWARRGEIETPGTLVQWDVRVASDGDAASHKWITQDIVKVECGFADASRSAMQLAEPYAVLLGDASVASRFPPLEPIAPEELEAYAQELRDQGMVPEVETQYGELSPSTASRDLRRERALAAPQTARPGSIGREGRRRDFSGCLAPISKGRTHGAERVQPDLQADFHTAACSTLELWYPSAVAEWSSSIGCGGGCRRGA